LRWKFKTSLASSALGFYIDGTGDLIDYQASTARVAGKKITLSFIPATQADADLVASYLPKPHADGTPIQPSELPTSLPGYLLNLRAELRIDGQIVAQSSGAVTMGQDLLQSSGFYSPGHSQWFEGDPNKPIAGEYHSIGIDLQGTSPAQLEALKSRLNATRAALEALQADPTDTTPIQNLTKVDLTGDLLYSGVLGYFASVDGNARLAARSGNQILMQRLPSFGAFAATVTPNYFFGIVRSVGFEALAMDIDQLFYQVAAKDNDRAKRSNYLRQVGAADSAFEHAVPEQLFKDPSKASDDPTQPQAVSAVRALAIAGAQGQRIYTLNAQNQGQHQTILANLNQSAALKVEISNALAAGKEVTVHEAKIDAFGFKGAGYVIVDPETGAGAYKIGGGANGGQLVVAAVGLAFLLVAAFFLISTWWLALIAGAAGFLANFLIVLSLGDDPRTLTDYAGLRLLTIIASIVLFIILDGIVFISFPALFLIGVLFSVLLFIRALVTVLIDALAVNDYRTRQLV
jgi:hypothetical protein